MAENTNNPLYLLFAIVDRGKRRRVRRTLEAYGIRFSLNLMGIGTAKHDLMTYLGLGDRERDIVLAGIPGNAKKKVLSALYADLKLYRQGAGIIFTLPMASVAGRATLSILKGDVPEDSPSEGGTMHKEEQADLIITIVQRGYSRDVVEAAKNAGAQGATVVHGRASGQGDIRRFYGITVEPQKDVVLMLVRNEVVSDVMRAICDKAGLKTAGLGISFSLPVTEVVGALGFTDPSFLEEN